MLRSSGTNGDEYIIHELLQAGDSLHHWLAGRLRDPHQVDDLVQETLLRAWESRGRFRGESSLSTWLHAIAKHLLWQTYRKNHRQDRLAEPLDEDHSHAVDTDDATSGHYDRLCVELSVDLALESLDSSDRWLYQSFYRNRYSIHELAKSSGLPEGTLKFRLFNLRRKLRKRLGERTA